MTEWSPQAQKVWESYCLKVREKLDMPDHEIDEALNDIRNHLEEEFKELGWRCVEAKDMYRALDRIGLPEEMAGGQGALDSKEILQALIREIDRSEIKRPGFWTFFCGIILPVMAVGVELLTGLCAGCFYDPLPSIWHVGIFLFIPFSVIVSRGAGLETKANWLRWLLLFNGVALGFGIIYSVMFLPILPAGMFGLLVLIGLCAFAPMLALWALSLCRVYLKAITRLQGVSNYPALWIGVLAGFGVFGLVELPTLVTYYGMYRVTETIDQDKPEGLGLLRALGNRKILLDACYIDDISWGSYYSFLLSDLNISPETSRTIYYRVTGEMFNSHRPSTGATFLRARRTWMWDAFDFEQGGDQVGACMKGLSLKGSRMDGFIEPDGALGYLEWTMVFRNDFYRDHEARAQIELPPGGVVSRLTLWIDGEEREAAFDGRSKTKAAYKSVVERRRDPVLVTTSGPDQVMMQCFPVPRQGGEMKVRIGITFPLELAGRERARLYLPVFNERNFAVNEILKHEIWLESSGEFIEPQGGLRLAGADKNRFAIRGTLSDSEIQSASGILEATRDATVERVWCDKQIGGRETIIEQRMESRVENFDGTVVVVVDGSKRMGAFVNEMITGLEPLVRQKEITLVFACDGYRTVTVKPGDVARLKAEFKKQLFAGGMDNVGALTHAWDLADGVTPGRILWLHCGQPTLMAPIEGLSQRFERRLAGPRLVEVQLAAGPDRIVSALDGIAAVTSAPCRGEVAACLARTIRQWLGEEETVVFTRRILDSEEPPAGVKRVSSHLARLAAADQVNTLRMKRDQQSQDEAVRLAIMHQLVTPVSGAVVLETQQQYQAADLKPSDPETVPVVPEPATLLLMGTGMAMLMMRRRRQSNG